MDHHKLLAWRHFFELTGIMKFLLFLSTSLPNEKYQQLLESLQQYVDIMIEEYVVDDSNERTRDGG